MISLGCTDVILADISDGALGHLQAAHIRAWAVPAPVAGNEALRIFGECNYFLCLLRAQQRDRARTMKGVAPDQPEEKLPSVAGVERQTEGDQ